MSGPARGTNIDKIFSLVITIKKIRHQSRVSRSAGAKIEVEKAIVVHISEVRSHRRNRTIETGLMCDINKGPLAGIAVQLHGVSLPRQCEVGSHPVATGKVVASDE